MSGTSTREETESLNRLIIKRENKKVVKKLILKINQTQIVLQEMLSNLRKLEIAHYINYSGMQKKAGKLPMLSMRLAYF